MNLNPFELRNNDYNAKDMYGKGDWRDCSPINPCKDLFDEEYGSYEYLLKGINQNIDWKSIVYAGSYQGELYCLGMYANKYYFVKTGYGSCSGCDWYQANDGSIEGLQEIQDGLKRDLREFESIDEFLEYFNREEISGWYKEEAEEFIKDVKLKYNINTK